MQFLIVIVGDEKAAAKKTVEETKATMTAYYEYTAALKSSGSLVSGEALEPSSKGARITSREGRTVVTDGPFAEAKEVVGGFYLIDVKTREEAIEWATKCPALKHGGGVELRQIMTFPK
jgi:hypothetical protein